MKAMVVNKAQVLEWQEVDDPTLKDGELLIKVHAAAVNRADLLQRRGLYPPPAGASTLLGLEVAGEIGQLGANCVGQWQIGQPIMCLLVGGGYAELVAVSEALVMPVPNDLSFEQAAALPEAFLTAYLNLVELGNLQKDQAVLIHAAGSGVGTAAIQIARELGAFVIVTAGSQEKLAACQALGASGLINYKTTASFADEVRTLTDNKGVNLILDFVGAAYFEQNLASLAVGGKLLLIGQLSGAKANLDLTSLMVRRLHVTGTTLRALPLSRKADLVQNFAKFALPRFEDKRFKPIVDRTFKLEQANEAHKYMETNANFGKIVLTL